MKVGLKFITNVSSMFMKFSSISVGCHVLVGYITERVESLYPAERRAFADQGIHCTCEWTSTIIMQFYLSITWNLHGRGPVLL